MDDLLIECGLATLSGVRQRGREGMLRRLSASVCIVLVGGLAACDDVELESKTQALGVVDASADEADGSTLGSSSIEADDDVAICFSDMQANCRFGINGPVSPVVEGRVTQYGDVRVRIRTLDEQYAINDELEREFLSLRRVSFWKLLLSPLADVVAVVSVQSVESLSFQVSIDERWSGNIGTGELTGELTILWPSLNSVNDNSDAAPVGQVSNGQQCLVLLRETPGGYRVVQSLAHSATGIACKTGSGSFQATGYAAFSKEEYLGESQ